MVITHKIKPIILHIHRWQNNEYLTEYFFGNDRNTETSNTNNVFCAYKALVNKLKWSTILQNVAAGMSSIGKSTASSYQHKV